MGGYSGDSRRRLGLLALLAMRRARAEGVRRGADNNEVDATDDDEQPPVPPAKPKRRGRWF